VGLGVLLVRQEDKNFNFSKEHKERRQLKKNEIKQLAND